MLSVRAREMKTKLIRLPRQDRESLAGEFEEEIANFLNHEPKLFDPGYKLDNGEIFKIEDFALPEHLVWAANNSEACGDIQRAEVKPQTVKAIVGVPSKNPVAEESSEISIAAFKSLNRSRVLDASRRRFEWTPDTFVKSTNPSVVVPEDLDAVYSEGSLYFRTFRTTNSFLDLTYEFTELTNDAVQGVLDEVNWLSYQDKDVPLDKVLNQTCRRLFLLIQATENFPDLELDLIKSKALGLGFPLRTSRVDDSEVIVLPSTPTEMKDHLEFLLQRFYPGIFDGRLRRSNSSEIV